MAKYNLYAIKDTVVGELMNPLPMHNDEEAKRTFKEAVNSNNPQSSICKNFKDMQMICLGTFDSLTGQIVSDVRFIANGVDVKEALFSMDIKPDAKEAYDPSNTNSIN